MDMGYVVLMFGKFKQASHGIIEVWGSQGPSMMAVSNLSVPEEDGGVH